MRSKTDWAEAKASKDSTRNLHAWALLRRARIGGRYECTCCLVVAPNLRQFPVLYFVKLTFTETYNLWMDVRPGFVKLSVTRRYIMCQNHEIPFPIHEFQRLPTVPNSKLPTPWNSLSLSLRLWLWKKIWFLNIRSNFGLLALRVWQKGPKHRSNCNTYIYIYSACTRYAYELQGTCRRNLKDEEIYRDWEYAMNSFVAALTQSALMPSYPHTLMHSCTHDQCK